MEAREIFKINMKLRNGEGEKRGKDLSDSPFTHSTILLFAVCCLMLALLPGCIAIAPEEDPVKKDINSLKQDMAAQQQRLAFLEETIKTQTAGLEKNLATQKKRLDSIDEAVQRQKADVNASVDKVREDMAFLRGRFEEVEQAVKKANEDMISWKERADSGLRAYNSELNNRLADLQNQIAALEKRLAAAEERLTSLERAKIPSVSEESQRQTNKQEAKPPKPDELYNEAIKLTMDKDYQNALDRFGRFLSLFPDHNLASNAQYWIGEIYYAQKDYERAVLEFNEVAKKYPKSKKVPAALLKQGLSFSKLGNKKEARLVLEEIVDTYPKTEEAGMAKKILKGMK
ncbi:MAG: tol-pal system protein YbgF [Deltaproteobacteria bacterium]|nr:tol-pal system protein YbgF [Deltaproteobacteria bacterium]